MIQSKMQKLFSSDRSWRKITFSELSKMYITGFLKKFAQGLIGVFIPIYLLKSGYSVQSIFLYFALLFSFAAVFNVFSAQLTARFGPKHVMRIGFFLQFVTALLLSQFSILPFPILLVSAVHAASASFYWLPYHVYFSKIKQSAHSGTQVSWLHTMEKIGGMLGPVLGGVLATFFGGATLFYAAAFILAVAIVILMLSPEPTTTRQKISYKHLITLKDWRTTVSLSAFFCEEAIAVLVWPLFLVTVVFTSSDYLRVGSIVSIATIFSTLVALPLGKLLDRLKGRKVLNIGAALNALLYLPRIIVTGFGGALLVAVLSEPASLIHRLAYYKGYYDSVDSFPGQRVAYFARNEIVSNTAGAVVWFGFTILAGHVSAYAVCVVAFLVGAVMSQAIRLERFSALR